MLAKTKSAYSVFRFFKLNIGWINIRMGRLRHQFRIQQRVIKGIPVLSIYPFKRYYSFSLLLYLYIFIFNCKVNIWGITWILLYCIFILAQWYLFLRYLIAVVQKFDLVGIKFSLIEKSIWKAILRELTYLRIIFRMMLIIFT
jgi:hypothetical protein